MAKTSGSNRSGGGDNGGFTRGDGTYRGKVENVRDLATIKNAAVYKEMKEGISRYHSVMGIRQRSVKLADLSPRTNGVHMTSLSGESEGIFLNSKVFDRYTKKELTQRVKRAYDVGWSTRTNKPVQHTITHELAHATWNNKLSAPNARAASPEIVKLHSQWKADKRKSGYGKYSQTNINEFWAEVVTKAVHGKPDKYTRAAKKIVKRYKL